MNKPVISLRNIWKTYSTGSIELTALKGITLDVNAGEFAAIMGPSGSGKSTLMHIIGCLDQKDEGEYYFKGNNIRELNQNELALLRNQEIGFVFQSFNLLPKLTLLENVALPMVYAAVNRKERLSRAIHALQIVGLEPWMQHKPNEVSGGQKQRAAIARAMVMQPALLIADEPTGNLDSRSSRDIMQLFQELNRSGTTIVLITHEADIASYAKRKLQVVDGQLVFDSTVQQSGDQVQTAV